MSNANIQLLNTIYEKTVSGKIRWVLGKAKYKGFVLYLQTITDIIVLDIIRHPSAFRSYINITINSVNGAEEKCILKALNQLIIDEKFKRDNKIIAYVMKKIGK